MTTGLPSIPMVIMVFLFSADANGKLTGFSDGFTFGASENGVTFGRYVANDGQAQYPAQLRPSLGLPNAGPKVGPVVINEIHYHPQGTRPEFVELKNITPNSVLLYDPQHPQNTRRVGGINFQFPVGTVIPSGGLLIITNVDRPDFASHYTIPDNLSVLGPFQGSLQDSGERLELLKPDEPDTDPDGSEIIPYIVIDAVRYNDNPPWPSEPDGNGSSLEKLNPERHGNDYANWRSSPGGPSPGVENMGNRPPQIMAGVDLTIETESLPVSVLLSGIVIDDANPDFPTVKTEWSFVNNQTTVIFANSGELQTSAELFGLGEHTFRLTADDGQYTASD